ncbi:MAG TPA: serine hydrolase domain-containing protein [Solirubrobacteraceae bacterium]|nr:serine hydrolase domain-containing protein [Solirubrobacteraceae bacterium]
MHASTTPRILATHHVSAGDAVADGFASSYEIELGTRFPVGSITKAIVALVAARLASHGRLSWDDVVARGGAAGSDVTLRQLLLHQAALPFELSPAQWSGPDLLVAELARAFDAPPRLALPPGTWHYSNLGYAMAAMALERATGAAFPELMRELVLDPLGMNETSYPDPEREGPTPLGAGAPAGGLWSTPEDLARLGAALDGASPAVVGVREVELLLHGGAALPDGTVWGAGVRTVPVGPHRILVASGTMSDRTTALVAWPRRGVSVLVAQRGAAHDELRDAAVERWRRPEERHRSRWWDGQEVIEARSGSSVELLLRETGWPYPLFAGGEDSGVLRGVDERGRPRELARRGDEIVGPGIRLTPSVGDSAFGGRP